MHSLKFPKLNSLTERKRSKRKIREEIEVSLLQKQSICSGQRANPLLDHKICTGQPNPTLVQEGKVRKCTPNSGKVSVSGTMEDRSTVRADRGLAKSEG